MRRVTFALVLVLVAASCGGAESESTGTGTSTSIVAGTPEPTVETETTTTIEPTTTTTSTTVAGPERWSTNGIDSVGRLVTDGVVVVGLDLSEDSLDIVAFDITDGAELWRAPWSPGGRFGGSGLGGFAIADGIVGHASGPLTDPDSTVLIGRDRLTGEPVWEIPAPRSFGVEACGPVFCAGRVASGPFALETLGLDPATGDQQWVTAGLDFDYVTDADLAISLWPGDEPVITGIDPAVGEIWRVRPEVDFGLDMTSNWGWHFARVDDAVIGVFNRPSEDSSITAGAFALDASTGELIWFVEDTRLTRWANDRTPMLSPYVPTDDGMWWEHTDLVVIDPGSGLSDSIVELPASDPVDEGADPEDVFTSFGVVLGDETSFDAQGNVFWFAGGAWQGIDPATAQPLDLSSDVLWRATNPFVGLEALGGSVSLGGPHWHAIDVATGEEIDAGTLDVPDFVGETADSWVVFVDADGAVNGFRPSAG